jgi:hypothetical protein
MYCVRFATFFRDAPRFGNLPPGGRGVGEIKPSLLEYLRISPRASEKINPFFVGMALNLLNKDLKT